MNPRKTVALIASAALAAASMSTAYAQRTAPQTVTEIAFTRHGAVYLMDSDGREIRPIARQAQMTIPANQDEASLRYGWSPDGRYLALDMTGSFVKVINKPTPTTPKPRVVNAKGQLLSGVTVASAVWALDTNQTLQTRQLSKTTGQNALITLSGTQAAAWTYREPSPVLTCDMDEWPSSDPAVALYANELGQFAEGPPTLIVSVKKSLAIFSPTQDCDGVGLIATDLWGHRIALTSADAQEASAPGKLRDGTLSHRGMLVAVNGDGEVVIIPHLGAQPVVVGRGTLPAWAPDGSHVFYVKQIGGVHIPGRQSINAGGMPMTISASSQLMEANANGSHVHAIYQANVLGFGPLHPTPNGTSLIFSAVTDDSQLYAHLGSTRIPTPADIAAYGPMVSIDKLDLRQGRVTVLARNAGNPQVEP